ncbi:MAG: hypothetical protein KKE98_07920 [Nanoarchaeota archaeon]|nr:hypothetical protein [Nanoarchaeota archaeon]MBU2441755.1 hypothetical protein [Nanoarchaeota archaeon]
MKKIKLGLIILLGLMIMLIGSLSVSAYCYGGCNNYYKPYTNYNTYNNYKPYYNNYNNYYYNQPIYYGPSYAMGGFVPAMYYYKYYPTYTYNYNYNYNNNYYKQYPHPWWGWGWW